MASPSFAFLSDRDGYVPEMSSECVAFARSETDFPLMKYAELKPEKNKVFLFGQLGRDEFIRDTGRDLKAWQPGDATPDGENNQIPFLIQEGRCFDHIEAWRLAYDVIDQSTVFKPKVAYARAAITKMMTDRTNAAVGILTTSSNWGSHTATATALNGGAGLWSNASDDPNSPNYLAIQRTLQATARQIHLDTNGVVKQSHLKCIIGPDLAIAMSQTAEMNNYVRQTPQALKLLEDGFDENMSRWSLPRRYKGWEFIVEDSPIVTAVPNATAYSSTGGYPSQPLMAPEGARSYIWPKSTAVVVARIGSLDGEPAGMGSYSTFRIFHYKGLLQSYAFDEPHNFRVRGMVKECIAMEIVANLSGFNIQGCM